MNTVQSVLIIEDDAWFAEQQVRVLEAAGFVVCHAADGLVGMALLDEALPDVVIVDMFLPGPNALVLLHEMQSHADLAMIPVIVCTNSVPSLKIDALAPYGVRTILDKGAMQPVDLVAAVKRVLP